jgi:hypothetical protein
LEANYCAHGASEHTVGVEQKLVHFLPRYLGRDPGASPGSSRFFLLIFASSSIFVLELDCFIEKIWGDVVRED